MQQIKCPKCGEVFTIDENSYANIVNQVRDQEFQRLVDQNKKDLEEKQETQLEKAVMEAKSEAEKTIAELHAKLQEAESQKKLAETEAAAKLQAVQAENAAKLQAVQAESAAKLQAVQAEDAAKLQAVQAESAAKLQAVQSDNAAKITALENSIQSKDKDSEIAVKDAVREKEDKIRDLQAELERKDMEFQLKEDSVKRQHEQEIRLKDEQIQQYKDFKMRQSTKMIGESLEQHCEMEFNKLRATGFRTAEFGKDNDARSGSKGDYIFRDYADGVEYISIMFEMKNEMDTTATKHKNEDFFKELDKDRNEKKCEYAVLVSMLESDNDYYNTGIVDVSHIYPKMYVIRPQFFIPIISMLRNAAENTMQVKKELMEIRNRNVDVSNFEASLLDFKDKFSANYEKANKRFANAIEEIDKTISHLQKVRDELLASDNQLRLANNKLEDLTIKKLVRNNPTMKEKFEEAGVDFSRKKKAVEKQDEPSPVDQNEAE